MSARIAPREGLSSLGGYHSVQVDVDVRLNTNESPYPPPPGWREAYVAAVGDVDFHRYPDRDATQLRERIGALHGVGDNEVFCANGSNEVLQCLLLAFGGHERRALVFEPTYTLHAHITQLTSTGLVTGGRDAGLLVDPDEALALMARHRPEIVFLCSPNNPTGRVEAPEVVAAIVDAAPGLVVVDEAYGQFARWSALSLRPRAAGLVVVRTFSKTWALAGARLGYLVADADVVAGCRAAALPYHLSVQTQLAGLLALDHAEEMAERVRRVASAREHLASALAELPVDTWPSDANFVLFRPRHPDPAAVWTSLVDEGVLIRDFSSRPGLEGCLRVTVGTPEENARFLRALEGILT